MAFTLIYTQLQPIYILFTLLIAIRMINNELHHNYNLLLWFTIAITMIYN